MYADNCADAVDRLLISEGARNFKLPFLSLNATFKSLTMYKGDLAVYSSGKDCTIRLKIYRMEPRNFNIL